MEMDWRSGRKLGEIDMERVATSEAITSNAAGPRQPSQWEVAFAQSESRSNEFLLVDLWIVLKSRARLILAVFFAALLLAVTLSFLIDPIYESRVVLEVGKVAGPSRDVSQAIEDPVVVVQRLREDHGFESRAQRKDPPYLESVGHPRNSGQSLIALTAHGRTPEEAQAFLAGITRPLLERHHELYVQSRSAKETQIEELEREIKTIEAQASTLASIAKNLDPGPGTVAVLERGNLLSTLAGLRAQRLDLVLSLAPVGSYPTRLIQEPTLPKEPIRPDPALYLSLGVALGLVLGIAVALIAESVSRARKMSHLRERRSPDQVGN